MRFAKWISEFPAVIKEGLGLLKGIPADIELEAGARSKFCKSKPIPFALKEQVEQLILQQVEDGELEPVESSDWAAPIVITKKKDGDIRIIMCRLQDDSEPPVAPEDIAIHCQFLMKFLLCRPKVSESYSIIDLSRAYKQMEVAERSRPLLIINTHMGLFCYHHLPFGIVTALAMWQRAMSVVLQDCKGVVYYIVDILVTGQTRREHEENLREVFWCLQQFGLKIKLEKCQFFKESGLLGTYTYNISSRTSAHQGKDCRHCAGIVQAPAPRNKVELKSFLGLMIIFCHSSLRSFTLFTNL